MLNKNDYVGMRFPSLSDRMTMNLALLATTPAADLVCILRYEDKVSGPGIVVTESGFDVLEITKYSGLKKRIEAVKYDEEGVAIHYQIHVNETINIAIAEKPVAT